MSLLDYRDRVKPVMFLENMHHACLVAIENRYPFFISYRTTQKFATQRVQDCYRFFYMRNTRDIKTNYSNTQMG